MKFKKTAKKLLSGLLTLVCTICICIKIKGTNTTTYCNEATDINKTKKVTVTHNLPSKIKIGQDLRADILEGKYYIQFNNLNPNKEVFFSTGDYGYNLSNGYNINNFNFATKKYFFTRHCGSCDSFKVSRDGICKDTYSLYYLQTAYKPGEITFQPKYCYKFSGSCLQIPKEKWIFVGSPIKIEIETPIIESNAPEFVKAGENFILKTQLENTCLIDSKVSEHNFKDSQCNSEGWADFPVYSPCVEILEGEDIIRRSHLNYKNTLQSSEKLEFLKPGLIKLKIKYEQLVTCKKCLQNSGNYHTYSPEKIVDIIVKQ